MSDVSESSSTFHKMKCTGCGAELKYLAGEKSLICVYCGVHNKTGDDSPAASSTRTIQSSAGQPTPGAVTPGKKNPIRKILIIGAVVIAIFFFMGQVITKMSRTSNSQNVMMEGAVDGSLFNSEKPSTTVLAMPNAESPGENRKPIVSDFGHKFSLKWKQPYLQVPASIQLYDSAGNIVWSKEYEDLFEGAYSLQRLSGDSIEAFFLYESTTKPQPGTWAFTLLSNGSEIVRYNYVVSIDPDSFAYGNCIMANKKINLANFYQLTPNEEANFKEQYFPDFDLFSNVVYGLSKRINFCQSDNFDPHAVYDGNQEWYNLTGIFPRNQQPQVTSEIQEVMPVFTEEFFFVNPEFVNWFAQNMIPSPDSKQVNQFTFQKIYEKAFQKRVRMIAQTCLFYQHLPDGASAEMRGYADMAARKYVNTADQQVMTRNDYNHISDYFQQTFLPAFDQWSKENNLTPEYGAEDYVGRFNTGTAIGFWLRRGIDGSQPALWKALRKILILYDKKWFDAYINPLEPK